MDSKSMHVGRLTRICACAMLWALAPIGAVHAQSNVGGYVYGDAGDGSFTIVIENEALGIKRSVTSDGDGQFRISGLPIGEYVVSLVRGGEVVGSTRVRVQVGVGSMVSFATGAAAALDDITVTAGQVAPIDFSQTESTTVFSDRQIAAIAVPRNITNVALLAPGTVQGDPNFGNFASFGGASVAENAYYVNGFNITNFRNGLGFSNVPFEFYKEFQVKTGGYGAEFGRSVGGVINSTTKRGTNVFQFGASGYFEPNGLREDPPSSFKPDGTPYIDNRKDVYETANANIYASGPVIKDTLFFYALANFRQVKDFDVTGEGAQYDKESSEDPFYGAKIDWNIIEGHSIDLTYFKDKNKATTVAFDDDVTSPAFGDAVGTSYQFRGGETYIAHYAGQFGPLGVSALYGHGEFDLTDMGSQDVCPVVIDVRTGATNRFPGCWTGSGLISAARDERDAYRLDFELPVYGLLGNHVFKAGLDYEDNTSQDSTTYSGGIYHRYVNMTPGNTLAGGTTPAGVTQGVRDRVYEVAGNFATKSSGLYIEDSWTPVETLTLRLGVRNETFENLNKNNETFIDMDNQWSPRLGVSWDPTGAQKSRVYMNIGRYFLPVVANTNVRLAGGELFTEAYYQCGPAGAPEACTYDPATGAPTNRGPQIGTTQILSDGSVPDVREILDTSIKPMYQDELILGFQTELSDRWTGSVAYIYRDLGRSIEDIIINYGLHQFARRNGLSEANIDGSRHYLLTNPGTSIDTAFDFDGDGTLEAVHLTAEDTGFPEAERRYNAVELSFERIHDGKWYLQGSYTWSQSYGNTEGLVRSDNDQDDSGITTQFDYPILTRGAKGYLPNDRTHQFKLFGTYDVAPEVTLGGRLNVASGRPRTAFGDDRDLGDPFTDLNAVDSTYSPDVIRGTRGSQGRTPWTIDLDLSARWMPSAIPGLAVGADIFNVLGRDEPIQYNETYFNGTATEERYGLANGWQTPRHFRLSAKYDFTM